MPTGTVPPPRLHCCISVYEPKIFDLVHQTIYLMSGWGLDTRLNVILSTQVVLIVSVWRNILSGCQMCNWWLKPEVSKIFDLVHQTIYLMSGWGLDTRLNVILSTQVVLIVSVWRNILSGCQMCNWWLKPEVSWVQLPVTAGFFTFLYFHIITSKFLYMLVSCALHNVHVHIGFMV